MEILQNTVFYNEATYDRTHNCNLDDDCIADVCNCDNDCGFDICSCDNDCGCDLGNGCGSDNDDFCTYYDDGGCLCDD